MRIENIDFEKSVIMSRVVVLWPGCEFLICWHERRSDVVGEEKALSSHMKELNDIALADNTAPTCWGQCFGWNDLPVVVGVIVRVSGNLLP
jgi:hypothetical protein